MCLLDRAQNTRRQAPPQAPHVGTAGESCRRALSLPYDEAADECFDHHEVGARVSPGRVDLIGSRREDRRGNGIAGRQRDAPDGARQRIRRDEGAVAPEVERHLGAVSNAPSAERLNGWPRFTNVCPAGYVYRACA